MFGSVRFPRPQRLLSGNMNGRFGRNWVIRMSIRNNSWRSIAAECANICTDLSINHLAHIELESVAYFAIDRLEDIASERVAELTSIRKYGRKHLKRRKVGAAGIRPYRQLGDFAMQPRNVCSRFNVCVFHWRGDSSWMIQYRMQLIAPTHQIISLMNEMVITLTQIH